MEEKEPTWWERHNIAKLQEKIEQLEKDADFALDRITEIEATLEQNNIRLKVKR